MTKTVHDCAMACFCVLFLAAPTAALGQVYVVTKLDPPSTGFGNFSRATSINNFGVVVGAGSAMYTTDIMCIWKPGQPYPDQHYFYGYNRTTAAGINDSGQYIGYGPKPDGTHGFLGSTDLGLGRTNDINNKGQVVGWTYDSSYIYKDGVFDYLPTSYWGSEALAINDSGVAAGYWISDCSQNCFEEICMFRNDSLFLLGAPVGNYGEAEDINDHGQIVGWYSLCGNCADYRGFIWNSGTWTIIPTLGGSGSEANAINEFGVVVGESRYTSGPSSQPTAIIYDTINGLRDLNTLIPPGTGWNLQAAYDINERGEIVGVGVYNGVSRGFLLSPGRPLLVKDAEGDSIPNRLFDVSRVHNDPPAFTEDQVYLIMSDSLGRLIIDPAAFRAGDSIKVSLPVESVPAAKHAGLLGTKCIVTLDNAELGAYGAISFDEVTGQDEQVLVLGHTTVHYSLLVSVEWDAEVGYLQDLQQSIRLMADFLYDITDGQVLFDTVMIYDDAQHWGEADLRINASNMVWPHVASLSGIDYSGWWGAPVEMPRKWFGNTDACREGTWIENPLELTAPDNFRTLAHEFGHYAPGFGDEYQFGFFGNRCLPRTPQHDPYGFMDYPYDTGEPWASEMSNDERYSDPSCRNNKQWSTWATPCWRRLEQLFEKHYGADSMWVPIVRPEERTLPPGFEYQPGPNNSLALIDYDAGGRITFPVVHGAPLARTVEVTCLGSYTGNPLPRAQVDLVRSYTDLIEQGETSTVGKIRVLGYNDGNSVSAYGIVVVQPGLGAAGVSAKQWISGLTHSFARPSSTSVDSLTILLRPVEGDYPFVFAPEWQGSTPTLQVHFANPLAQAPVCEQVREQVSFDSLAFSQLSDRYSAAVDTLGAFGQFVVNGLDALSQAFFVPIPYVHIIIEAGSRAQKLVAGAGDLDLYTSDSALAAPCSVLTLSSSYPVIPTGIAVGARQAGQAHGIASTSTEIFTGGAALTIRYPDADLPEPGLEESLKLFHWNETTAQWDLIGGEVDTSRNEVSASIAEDGVYAAFTTGSSVGMEDEPDLGLPFRFELSQNYPNPFNPITSIEYSVPSRIHVTIEIFNILGQQVRTLVNEVKSVGSYRIEWNGNDNAGRPVSTGVYLYRFSAGDVVQTKKMLLLK